MPLPFALIGSSGLEILGLLFTIWMIYECSTRERDSMAKILWLLLVIFLPGFGPLVYFLVRVVKIRGDNP